MMKKKNESPNLKPLQKKCRAGFTLVELLIAIALVAILSAIAAPSLYTWRQNTLLSSATRDLMSNFQKAKLTAVKQNAYCSVIFSSNGYVVFKDTDKDLVKGGGETAEANVSWSDYGDVVLDTSEGSGDGLTFNSPANAVAFAPDGLPKNDTGGFGAGTVYLKNPVTGRQTRVIVSSAGNIRSE